MSFRMKERDCSWIWVTAWKMATKNTYHHAQQQQGSADLQGHTHTLTQHICDFHLVLPPHRNPCIRVEKSSSHPSRAMNSSSLNGMEIMEGGNMIMPMDMRVDATTTSISTKGM